MHESVVIPAAAVRLEADLVVPPAVAGVVAFVHGSGSSRHSPRNRYVAGELHAAGMATLLADLLTPAEEIEDSRTGALRFDIDMLAARTLAMVDWLGTKESTAGLPLGVFGASTGAAGALVAAALLPEVVAAVVSRGGRPDLAGALLSEVHQPTLLIVGERDPVVVRLNRDAMASLAGVSELEIVPGATHLFPEPGALERVARLATAWFVRHLEPDSPPSSRSVT